MLQFYIYNDKKMNKLLMKFGLGQEIAYGTKYFVTE